MAEQACPRALEAPAGHPSRRRRIARPEPVAGARDHADRVVSGDVAPFAPQMELRQVVRSHQPDEAGARIKAPKGAECFRCTNGAKPGLDIRHQNARMPNDIARARDALLQRLRLTRLQRVSRAHQPPHASEVEPTHRLQGGTDMPLVRGIERSTEEADHLSSGSRRSCDRFAALSLHPPLGSLA